MAVRSSSSSFITTTSKQSMMPAIQSRSPPPTTMSTLSWRRPPPQFRLRCNGINKSYIVSNGGGANSSSKKSSSSQSSVSSSAAVPNSNYVVPLDKLNSSCITRPLAEILRDLNKRVPDNIVKPDDDHPNTIPWYHANRMLSFYAPGWCGEIRDVIFSDNGSVTVVYRVTIRGSDGEAHRESTGTVSSSNADIVDPVAAAEQIAFCKACARFGLGLYLFHEE